jgi:hypothetical protein
MPGADAGGGGDATVTALLFSMGSRFLMGSQFSMGSGFLEFDGVLLVIVAERCKRWYYELRISGVFVKADIVEI